MNISQVVRGRIGQYTITKQLHDSVWLATYVFLALVIEGGPILMIIDATAICATKKSL
jgi:hypothetical protein